VLGYPLYNGNPRLPEIALTFDDGPTPPYTSQILALLQRYGVKATFFVIGSQAAAYPDLVRQESHQGNIVGNHTWTHPNLIYLSPAAVRAQLQSTSNEIQAVTGVWPTVFRPPGGNFSSSVQSIAASLGLSTILWNVDPRDWSLPGASVIIQRILNSAHNGSIIIMHDGGGNRSETVAALPTIITALAQRGFQFVTIPRMIHDLAPLRAGSGPAPTSPQQLSPEESFGCCLTSPRSSISPGGTNADRRKACFSSAILPLSDTSGVAFHASSDLRAITPLNPCSIIHTMMCRSTFFITSLKLSVSLSVIL
jgi:peptidoglycan/xylan/chitin deacetylase (PgdA/CDA1 family)